MNYTAVFESLQELFPQIDKRILKATSIEHANNFEAAVEFILQEVAPSLFEPPKISKLDGNKSNLYDASRERLGKKSEVASTSSSILSPCHLNPTSYQNGKRPIHPYESDLDDSQRLFNSIVNTTPPKRTGSNHQVHVNDHLSRSSSSENRNWDMSVLIANNRASSPDKDFSHYSDQKSDDGGCRVGLKKDEVDGSKELNHQSVCQSEVITRSTHSVNPEVLEDIVSDAKNSKLSMLTSVEKLTTMLKNVVHLEEKAKFMKEEASTAGESTLRKVEELRQMLLNAKETNNMHAGEVYGERSILSTEARELQTRLLSLADEKNKSLEIMEEIHRTLEARLVAAEDEIANAEKFRIEREDSAQRALKEQEEMMDVIVEESKKLQQEAEENTKLRDFLVERGRLVDSLQGEIAVLCEDITRLKEIVDGHLPMTKSMLSTMSSLSSSTCSASTCTASYNKSIVSMQQDDIIVNPDEKIIMTESERETCDADVSSSSNNNDGWEILGS